MKSPLDHILRFCPNLKLAVTARTDASAVRATVSPTKPSFASQRARNHSHTNSAIFAERTTP